MTQSDSNWIITILLYFSFKNNNYNPFDMLTYLYENTYFLRQKFNEKGGTVLHFCKSP